MLKMNEHRGIKNTIILNINTATNNLLVSRVSFTISQISWTTSKCDMTCQFCTNMTFIICAGVQRRPAMIQQASCDYGQVSSLPPNS